MATAPPEPRRTRCLTGDALAESPNDGVDKNIASALEALPRSARVGGLLPGIDNYSNRSMLDAADELPDAPDR